MTFLRRAVTQTLRAPVRASVAPRVAMRSMASTPLRFSEHHQPLIQGEGSKAGELASDEEQSTGLERFELMGLHQGVDVFNMKPLEATRLGTVADPIKVETMVIGCTGFPVDSHQTTWMKLSLDKQRARCPHCGSVYVMDHQGPADAHHH